MRNLIQLPTISINSELELNYVSVSQSGYGHKTITVELIYNGQKKEFKHTTNNMPDYDDATDIEDYEEKNRALYGLISYSIEDQISEWIYEIENSED